MLHRVDVLDDVVVDLGLDLAKLDADDDLFPALIEVPDDTVDI